MKGQAFIVASVIFSSLILMSFLSSGPTVQDPVPDTKRFFSQSLSRSAEVFNDAVSDNRSIEHLKREMYSYSRFVERQSLERGIKYDSYSLILLPREGEAAFLNYYSRELKPRLRIDGDWENRTVKAKQSFRVSFPEGKASVLLEFERLEERHILERSTPWLLRHSEMDSADESWENTLLG